MMTQAAHDLNPEESNHRNLEFRHVSRDFESDSKVDNPPPKYLSELVSMGFKEDLALAVLENCPEKTPLHELVTILSDMQAGVDEESHQSDKQTFRPEDEDILLQEEEDEDIELFDEQNEDHLRLFAENVTGDYHDLSTKRALAQAVCDAVKSGELFHPF
jgi:hypothetical protein